MRVATQRSVTPWQWRPYSGRRSVPRGLPADRRRIWNSAGRMLLLHEATSGCGLLRVGLSVRVHGSRSSTRRVYAYPDVQPTNRSRQGWTSETPRTPTCLICRRSMPTTCCRHRDVRGGAAVGRGDGRSVPQGGGPRLRLAGGRRCDRGPGVWLLRAVSRAFGVSLHRRGQHLCARGRPWAGCRQGAGARG